MQFAFWRLLVLNMLTYAVVHAATLTFVTAPGAQSAAGNPVNFVATVTTDTDLITVQLDNLVADPVAIDQVITGLSFTLDFHDLAAIALSNVTGQLIFTPVNGAAPAIDNTDSIDHWGVSSSSATVSTTAISLTAFIGGTPSDGVIGKPGDNGSYNNVNSSITNGHASPLILYDAIFRISLPGVTQSTSIASPVFTLGTSSTDTVNGFVATPEPGTVGMIFLAGAFGLLGFVTNRRSHR